MIRRLLVATPLLALPLFALPAGRPATSAAAPTAAATAPLHCQVPCGIYGDKMRIDMLMEDAATIEKGMAQIGELSEGDPVNYNQLVRWVTTKDEHAQKIQESVAEYWLAQRVKAPKEGDEAAKTRYHRQLELMHGITVAAMKCKQTTDPANVAKVRELALAFSATYFSKEDLEHLEQHGQGR